MRTLVLTIFAGWMIVFVLAGPVVAAPPTDGGPSQFFAPLNPTNWSWPKMPWSEEPARIKRKPANPMTKMNKSAKQGWQKTKKALDPSWMFKTEPKTEPKTQPMSNSSESGFFGRMMQPKEDPEKIKTVNDFLNQPQPR